MSEIDKTIANDQIYNILQKKQEVWELFTKKEEYHPIKADNHGRFAYEYSKHKNVLQPSVSKYLIDQGYQMDFPDHKKF